MDAGKLSNRYPSLFERHRALFAEIHRVSVVCAGYSLPPDLDSLRELSGLPDGEANLRIHASP